MAVIDLTTLPAVKSRAEIPSNNSNDDQDISDAITGFSAHLANRFSGVSFAQVAVVETRDGNGNDMMFVRTPPISTTNAISISINGVAVPAAGAWPAAGYYVTPDGRAFKLRNVAAVPLSRSFYPLGGGGLSLVRANSGFARGQGNVTLSYTGGYNGVPADLEYAVRCVVAINYKRKAWQDLDSKSVSAGSGGSSTTRYRDWAWPPEYESVFDFYTPKAVVST